MEIEGQFKVEETFKALSGFAKSIDIVEQHPQMKETTFPKDKFYIFYLCRIDTPREVHKIFAGKRSFFLIDFKNS